MNTEKIRSILIYTLVAGVIAAALTAVAAIMLGGFNDTIGKIIWTLVIVIIHALIGLTFVWTRKDNPQNEVQSFGDILPVSNESLLILTVVSAETAVAGVWFLDSAIVFKLYATYAVIMFAILHTEVLLKLRGLNKTLRAIVNTNIALIVPVAAMLILSAWAGGFQELPDLFNRTLASLGVLDVTFTVLSIIMYIVYLKNNPEAKMLFASGKKKKSSSIGRVLFWLFIIFFILPTVTSLLFSIIFAF